MSPLSLVRAQYFHIVGKVGNSHFYVLGSGICNVGRVRCQPFLSFVTTFK